MCPSDIELVKATKADARQVYDSWGYNPDNFLYLSAPPQTCVADAQTYLDHILAGVEAGQPLTDTGTTVGIGDGWFRELRFDLTTENPSITVKTHSTHYDTYSGDLPTYGKWYKQQEQPEMSDERSIMPTTLS